MVRTSPASSVASYCFFKSKRIIAKLNLLNIDKKGDFICIFLVYGILKP